MLEYSFEKFKVKKKNCYVLDDINFDASRYRFIDHISSKIAEKYYENNSNKLSSKFFNISFGQQFLERIIKKEVLLKTSLILQDLFLANIAVKKMNLREIYIYNPNIDHEFLKIVTEYINIKRNLKFTFKDKIIFLFKKNIFKVFNFFKIFLLLEIILFATIKTKKNITEFYSAAVRIDSGLKFNDYPYSPSLLTEIKNINNNDIIFYNETRMNKNLKSEIKKFKDFKSVIYFGDLVNKIKFKKFFRIIYLKNLIYKFEYLKLLLKLNIFSSSITKSYENYLFWTIFYNIFKTKNNITLTIDHGVTANYLHKIFKVKSSFIYPHFTEQLSNFYYRDKPTSSDYSYLQFDELYSDRTSKKYLDTLIDYNDFNEIGFLFKNYISKQNINALKKDLDINLNQKTIFFYDASVGPRGVMTLDEEKIWLYAIKNFLKKTNFNVCLRVKSIKMIDEIDDIKKIIIELKKYKNFKLLNDYKIEKYSLLSVPDLIISNPISTIVFEALSLDKKILLFNPLKKYKKLPFLLFNNQKLIDTAENQEDLLNFAQNIIYSSEQSPIYDKYFLKTNDSLENLEKIFI